jgi:hypothetical protein
MNEHNATWKQLDNMTSTGWSVLRVCRRVHGMCGLVSELGFDNTRPDESVFMTERRIAKRFDVKRRDLVLEVL